MAKMTAATTVLVVEIAAGLDDVALAKLDAFERAVTRQGGRRMSAGKTRVYLTERVEGGGKVDAALEELRGSGGWFAVRRFVQPHTWV